jgi:pyruvate kinase
MLMQWLERSRSGPNVREMHRQMAETPSPVETFEEIGGGEPLYLRLRELREELLACERTFAKTGAALSDSGSKSAVNLVHYLALRRGDLRGLQERLAERGLSSLGRAESHVLASLDELLARLEPSPSWLPPSAEQESPRLTRAEGRALLADRTRALFGPPPDGRSARIMVTAPDEAAERYEIVRELVASGMNCMRINCAHDDPAVWEKMIANLRRAELEVDARCTLLMDLPGPRARTGPMEPGPQVVKVRPRRDALGRVTRPAQLWLCPQEAPTPAPSLADAVLPLPGEFLASLDAGDRLVFRDARDARRALRVIGQEDGGRWATLDRTAYIVSGTRVRHAGAARVRGAPRRTSGIGPLPPTEQFIRIGKGDRLVLTRGEEPGRCAILDAAGREIAPARIPCTPPEVLDNVRVGEPIWFDDGRIGGIIESVGDGEVVVAITSAKTGAKLSAEKGINLPETELCLPALMPGDLEILPFVARHADLVGYSFVRSAKGVEELMARLDALPGKRPGVVLKIETARAFEALPALLLEALRHPPVGVMIARGDLSVECGFARLAEVQEEILWLCEAAHVPVIWATQVLEGLAKTGRPTRAEITDAAAGGRAECVMLNKGPFIVDAVRALGSVLERMQAHQEKKQSLLRELEVAGSFLASMAAWPIRKTAEKD